MLTSIIVWGKCGFDISDSKLNLLAEILSSVNGEELIEKNSDAQDLCCLELVIRSKVGSRFTTGLRSPIFGRK
jgi:hypothetical protein